MAVTHQIDETARRVVMITDGVTTGSGVTDLIERLIRARPELADWDWINDVRASTGRVDNADIERTARAFADQGETAWTVFVSEDANLAIWTKVMDAMFARRLHLVAHDLDAAHRLLDRKRGR